MSIGAETPIGRVLGKLEGVKRSDGGWVARCPAHGDKHQSLGIDVEEGRVLLRCHAGCEVASIVTAMGLGMADLFPGPATRKGEGKGRESVTLAELCELKKLPIDFARTLGWKDSSNGHSAAVEMPYVRRDGSVHRTRLRVALSAKDRFRWGKGEGMIAYDPDRGVKASRDGYLVIVEGETDVATLLCSDVPAIGIPGATATHTLERHHVDALKCLFVVRETDTAGDGFVAAILERTKELGFEGQVYPLKMPGAAKDPSALYVRDPLKFPEVLHAAMLEQSKPPPELLDDVWKTLREWGSLDNEPPPRRWLLDRPDDETNGARRIGVLPLSKVGMLVSAGGVGKTMALVELALAVATGRKWFEHFGVQNPGPVLLALGEEDGEEIWRRVFTAARAMRLTDEQMEKARDNIVALPLAGTSVALVISKDGATTDTPIMASFRKRLMAAKAWRLIILDPLSRFAGFDTEKDNAAATRFIEAIESLAKSPGGPTVLVAHHTNKTSRTDGSSASASHARGASALSDGVRWVANLERLSDDAVSFEVTKTNYAPSGPSVPLFRDGDNSGYMRVQLPAEATARLEQVSKKSHARMQTMRELVLKTIAEHPGIKSGNDIYTLVKGNRPALLAAFKELKLEGWIETSRDGLKLTERSGLKDA